MSARLCLAFPQVGLLIDLACGLFCERCCLLFVWFRLGHWLWRCIPKRAEIWYTLVFGMLGITPVTVRMFNYYTLEIADRDNHPSYLSTLSLAMSAPPFFLSVFFGWLVDQVSFEFVFLLVVACMLTGWVLTFWLKEPRMESAKGV